TSAWPAMTRSHRPRHRRPGRGAWRAPRADAQAVPVPPAARTDGRRRRHLVARRLLVERLVQEHLGAVPRGPGRGGGVVRSVPGRTPRVDPTVYVDEAAQVIGDVTIEAGASGWPVAVLRGDT